MSKLIEIGLLIVTVPLLMGAQVYRWVDQDGVVNFTQVKPPGVKAQQINIAAAGLGIGADQTEPIMVDESVGDAPALSEDQDAMLRDLKLAERQRQREVARIKQANCSKSQTVLTRLSQNRRIRVRDDAGTERIMDEDERQRRIGEAHLAIAENCTF